LSLSPISASGGPLCTVDENYPAAELEREVDVRRYQREASADEEYTRSKTKEQREITKLQTTASKMKEHHTALSIELAAYQEEYKEYEKKKNEMVRELEQMEK